MAVCILGVIASAYGMPTDSLFSAPASLLPGLKAGLETENDRALGQGSILVRGWADSSLSAWDTIQLQSDPSGIGSGDEAFQAIWSRGPSDAMFRLLARTNGLGALDPSVAEHAWLSQTLGRWRWSARSWRGGFLGGALVESQDPGSNTKPLEPDRSIGTTAANAQGGIELSWHGTSELAPFAEGFLIQDLLPSPLRWSKAAVSAGASTSLGGDGGDSLRLNIGWDTLRLQSSRFAANLGEGNASAQADWNLRAGRQSWTLEGALTRSVHNDATTRSPGLERTSRSAAASLSSPLPAGASHGHRLELDFQTRRWWTSSLAGTPDIWVGEDRKNDDETRILKMSDSLHWTSSDSAWTTSAVVQQSLSQVRHPENETPSASDRPDEDLSVRMFTCLVRSRSFAPSDRPLASWTTLFQQDVFPRSTQSVRTFDRSENRLAADVALPLFDIFRPLLGGWAREQRNEWRFDSSRASGLLDVGWTSGMEFGPYQEPWFSLRFANWTTKTGSLLADKFAPDRIQDDWSLALGGSIPIHSESRILPWGRWQLERTRSWDGLSWTGSDRSTTSRLGSDASYQGESVECSIGAGHQWSDPGIDSWIARLEAKWTF